MRRIRWLTPGLVWGMDDTEYDHSRDGSRWFLHNLMDLGSRFCFSPLGNRSGVLDGEEIADWLEKRFRQWGARCF